MSRDSDSITSLRPIFFSSRDTQSWESKPTSKQLVKISKEGIPQPLAICTSALSLHRTELLTGVHRASCAPVHGLCHLYMVPLKRSWPHPLYTLLFMPVESVCCFWCEHKSIKDRQKRQSNHKTIAVNFLHWSHLSPVRNNDGSMWN